MSAKYRILVFFILAPLFALTVQFCLFKFYVDKDFHAYILDLALSRTQILSHLISDGSTEVHSLYKRYDGNIQAIESISNYYGRTDKIDALTGHQLAAALNKDLLEKLRLQLETNDVVPFFAGQEIFFAIKDLKAANRIFFFKLSSSDKIVSQFGPHNFALAGKSGFYSEGPISGEVGGLFRSKMLLSKISTRPAPSAFFYDIGSQEGIVGVSPLKNSSLSLISLTTSRDQSYFSHLMFTRLGLVLAGLILIVAGTSFYLAQSFIAPINYLVNAMDRISSADFNFNLTYQTDDEFGRLTKRFNQMIESIRQSMGKQAELARMKSELDTATIVQRLFNNTGSHSYGEISITGLVFTASECGGDFWTHFENDERIFVFLGDATGHGTPAALVTSAASSALHVIRSQRITNISEALHALNYALHNTTRGEIYMTMIGVMIDRKNGFIEVANAGHVPAYYALDISTVSKWNEFEIFDQRGSPVGRDKNLTLQVSSIPLKKNTQIMLCTDGFFDVDDLNGKKMNDRTLLKMYLEATKKTKTNADISRFVHAAMVEKLQGANPPDDMTLISISLA